MSENQSVDGFLAPTPEFLAPLFPAYQIHSLIATGGMGAVYHAVQISLDREVAIKILPTEFSNDETFCLNFEAEAKAMAKLNHPNLIGVFDFGEVSGMLFIVMEYVPGKSLHDAGFGAALDAKEVIRLIKKVALGLAHAHDNGILHRDIKPANILLDQQGQPKIGDFGLARPVDLKIQDGEVIYGTPGYTAPEVLVPPHHADQRADIFSLGVMLHELLTGKLPEADRRPPSAICHCDVRLDAVVRKATQPRPELRYQSAAHIADDLEIIENSPASLAQQTNNATMRRPAAMHHVMQAPPPASAKSSNSGFVVVLLLALAVCGYIFRDKLMLMIKEVDPKSKLLELPFLSEPNADPNAEPIQEPSIGKPVVPPKAVTGNKEEPELPAVEQPIQKKPAPTVNREKLEKPEVWESLNKLAPSDQPEVPHESAPTVAKLDVADFLKTAQGVMIRKSAFDISRSHDALEKNIIEFKKEGRRLIRKYISKYRKDYAEKDFDMFVDRLVQGGNRVGNQLPYEFEGREGFEGFLENFQRNETKIEADLASALNDEAQTYIKGLEIKIQKLREDNDPVAADEIQSEIDKVKQDSAYFVEMMVKGNK